MRRYCRKKSKSRRGAAVVEFACALPPLFLIVFGSIEACNAIFLKQFITEVGYQGALAATRPDATELLVETDMQNLLAARGFNSATVELTGALGEDYDTLPSGMNFKVRVQIPTSEIQKGPSIANYFQLESEAFGRRP